MGRPSERRPTHCWNLKGHKGLVLWVLVSAGVLRLRISGWLLVLSVLLPRWSYGSVPGIIASQVQGITDSARAKVLTHLARGELVEAAQAYKLARGRKAPTVLNRFKAAFDVSKQVPGSCQAVAKTIHSTFTQFGGTPEYVKLTTAKNAAGWRADFIDFEMAKEQFKLVSETGFHVVVRMNGRAYDAFTGASGLPWQEYMNRLGARTTILPQVVSSP